MNYYHFDFTGIMLVFYYTKKIILFIGKDLVFLVEKLSAPTTTVTTYIELKLLIEEELTEIIPYFALYAHCRRKHKSKLKVAQKSHYKKDLKTEDLYFILLYFYSWLIQ